MRLHSRRLDDELRGDFRIREAACKQGEHVAFTHWSAGGTGVTDVSKQVGVFQYCSDVSGAALQSFMDKYPFSDAPEPAAM